MKRRTKIDKVWRAVVTHTWGDNQEYIEYFGPFATSAPAAAAITRLQNSPWARDKTVFGVVECATPQWERRQ